MPRASSSSSVWRSTCAPWGPWPLIDGKNRSASLSPTPRIRLEPVYQSQTGAQQQADGLPTSFSPLFAGAPSIESRCRPDSWASLMSWLASVSGWPPALKQYSAPCHHASTPASPKRDMKDTAIRQYAITLPGGHAPKKSTALNYLPVCAKHTASGYQQVSHRAASTLQRSRQPYAVLGLVAVQVQVRVLSAAIPPWRLKPCGANGYGVQAGRDAESERGTSCHTGSAARYARRLRLCFCGLTRLTTLKGW